MTSFDVLPLHHTLLLLLLFQAVRSSSLLDQSQMSELTRSVPLVLAWRRAKSSYRV